MKRRKLRPWVIYLLLTVCLLFAGVLFVMNKNRETAAPNQAKGTDSAGTDNPVSSADNTENTGSQQNTQGQTAGNNKQDGKGNSGGSSPTMELPEIEIPAETNLPVSQNTPQESHPAETDPPVSQPENTPNPEPKPQEPENSGILTNENGDIMLPEIP